MTAEGLCCSAVTTKEKWHSGLSCKKLPQTLLDRSGCRSMQNKQTVLVSLCVREEESWGDEPRVCLMLMQNRGELKVEEPKTENKGGTRRKESDENDSSPQWRKKNPQTSVRQFQSLHEAHEWTSNTNVPALTTVVNVSVNNLSIYEESKMLSKFERLTPSPMHSEGL